MKDRSAEATDDPWDDDKDDARHLTECKNDDCERCNQLIDGEYMACDSCGHWGQQDAHGWVLVKGIPFCSEECAEKRFGEPVEIQ